MKRHLTAILLSLAVVRCASAAELSLADAEKSAAAYSPRLKAALHDKAAAENRAGAQKAQRYPKLFIDGSYRYVTSVQEITLPIAGFKPVKFGDNTSYSIGPAASWTAWDSGYTGNNYKSAEAAARAKSDEAEAVSRQVLFAARSAYFQVALAGEQAALYSDALKLAQVQYEDIKLNARAGTKSRADELQSHQEVLARMKQLRQAQADLVSALRDLSAVTGADCSDAKPESLDGLLARFEPYAASKLDENHPALRVYSDSADSAGFGRKAAGAGGLPKVQLTAKASVDYPNGNQLESYNQNTVGASLNWTFFEAGATGKREKDYDNTRSSALEKREQAVADMKRDWGKTMDQLDNLAEQRKLNEVSVSETEQLSQIIYKTYKTGSISFIEVENANFKALEAKIQSAKTKVQSLMYMAVLASMAQ